MSRLRYNGLSTTLGGTGLTTTATAVTFAAALTYNGGTAVPTITGSDYIPLTILDSSGKLSEVVWLTAYTAGATTGTVTRAQEGTTGVAHSAGDKVAHAPTTTDIADFMLYYDAWVAGTYPKGAVVTYSGKLWCAKASTSATPTPPSTNYAQAFTTTSPVIPADGLWTSTVAAGLSITNGLATSVQGTPSGGYTRALIFNPSGSATGDASASLTLTFAAAGNISFQDASHLSGTSNQQYMQFYIDGVLQHQFYDWTSWTARSYAVGVGTHTFTWQLHTIVAGGGSSGVTGITTTGSTYGGGAWAPIGYTSIASSDIVTTGRSKSAKRTSGDVTVNSTTFVNVDTGLDLAVSAAVGDVIELGLSARVDAPSGGPSYAVADFHTIVSGSPVNSVVNDGAVTTTAAASFSGWGSGNVNGSPNGARFDGRKRYTVVAGDLVSGVVTFRLRMLDGVSCTVKASDPMLYVSATNLGPG